MMEQPATERYDRGRPLVFVHILKTAGMSLIKAVSNVLTTPPVSPGFDRMLFGAFTDFDSMSPGLQKVVWRNNTGFATGTERFVATHMALSTLRAAYPSAQFITLLREPVARVLSHWLYWRVASDAELAVWGQSWADHVKLSRRPLVQFLTAPQIAAQTDNLCLRTLVWPHPLIPDYGFIEPAHDDELLAAAVANLARLDFVGVLEDPRFETRFSAWLGSELQLPRENIVRPLPLELRSDFSTEITAASAALAGRSRLDRALWKHAIGRTAEMSAEETQVTSLIQTFARLETQLRRG